MSEQLPIDFGDERRPDRAGRAAVEYGEAKSILTPATGFMSGYDYTLNPYSGCSFGCTYCYAASFARSEELRDTWGAWVRVKENAVSLLRRMRKPITGATIYMSSVTDPYQPIERRLGLVRALLEVLVERQPRLVVQTRSPLVTRDLDVLARFDHVKVNMTVTTDSDEVRRAFEPDCPANRLRLDAISQVCAAGIDAAITMTPLLPVADADAFADQLLATGVRHFVVQPFHAERGKFVAGTRDAALEIVRRMNWDDDAYRRTVTLLRSRLPALDEGREGFTPA